MNKTNGSTRTNSFSSLASMRETHSELLARLDEHGDLPEFLDEVETFVNRGKATGALLDNHLDRRLAQSMLGYWANVLYRAGRDLIEVILAEFDPMLAPELSDDLCPYLGLAAFQENDKPYFFGRDQMIKRLVDHLKENRLLAVIGPSGSGKSSLVLGGLLPTLKNDAISDSRSWRYYPPMVPGSKPMENLARLISSHDRRDDVQAEDFQNDEGCLHRLINEAGALPAVFVVDQLEEIFTLVSDDEVRQAFVDNLLRLVEVPEAGHIVILTMRTDFESQITRVPALQERFEDALARVTPLNAKELRDAIEKPAEAIGLKFEEGIVDALLQDILGEPAALPLLQFSLLKLWESRKRNRVTWEAYRRLGGGRLALARSADEFYNGLIPEEQDAARRILLRLVRPGERLEVTSNRIRREVLYQIGLAEDRIDRVLNKLIQARLVRLTEGDNPDDAQVEVGHEALVRNWPTLIDWIEDQRETIRRRLRVTEAAEQWVERNRDESVLLRGPVLEDARRHTDLSDLEKEFVEASVALEEREAAEQEEQRQRELEQARALAEAERQRAEAERKQAEGRQRLQRRIIGGLAAFLAVALILAVFAFQQRQEALRQHGIAEAENQKTLEAEKKAIKQAIIATGALEKLTTLQQRQEYERTVGQIEGLRELSKTERKMRTKTAFDSATTYLWSKQDAASLAKLVQLLKDSEDLLEDYPVVDDSWVGYVMPFVEDTTDWPLTLKYNPKQQLDHGLLQYQWRQMALNMSIQWGIPAPMRLKLQEDRTIPIADIHIIVPEPFDSQQGHAQNKNQKETRRILKELPFLEDRVLVTENKLPEQLREFFDDHKSEFQPLEHLGFGGPWWFAPRWTLPLWKVAGHNALPKEALVAVTLANKLLDEPELVLTHDAVRYLLERERKSFPQTVKEALAARGGVDHIREVFIEYVRKDAPLTNLRTLLDFLAEYTDMSAAEMAENALNYYSHVDSLFLPLRGRQSGGATDSEDETATPDSAKSESDFQRAYEEASRWLPVKEPSIRVYLGSQLIERLTTPDDQLAPAIREVLAELRGEMYRRFGIIVPGVRFRIRDHLAADAFQIEVMTQTSSHSDKAVQPIHVPPDRALGRLEEELHFRLMEYRTWWLTPERVYWMLDDLPDNLRKWLGERYTLTDLKLIMRAVILPSTAEWDIYNDRLSEKVFEAIPPENTLARLPWLLGSLAFWMNMSDPLNGYLIAEHLRSTQQAYLEPSKSKLSKGKGEELIKRGIEEIERGEIESATNTFKEAAEIDRNAASLAFLAQYPQSQLLTVESRLKQLKSFCKLPAPGKVSKAWLPTAQTRRDLEIFLGDFGQQVNPKRLRSLQLYLFWSYVTAKHDNKAAVLQEQLLSQHNTQQWTPDEEYFLAYRMLDAHAPGFTSPTHLNQIQELLSDAFSKWDDKRADTAFNELVKLYGKTRAPNWYWAILQSLAELRPQSYWIPYLLGDYIAKAGEGGSQEDVKKALTLFKQAESNLPNAQVNPTLREVNPTVEHAWLNCSRADFHIELARYGQADSLEQALKLLNSLIERIPEAPKEQENWPSLESIYLKLLDIHQMKNDVEQLTRVIDDALQLFPDSEDIHYRKFFFALTEGKTDEAVKLAQEAQKKEGWNRESVLFITALAQVLTRTGEFEHEARRFLQTGHSYRDYIRMMLYWALIREGKAEEARELLKERWQDIDLSTWPKRIEQGDLQVWREMFIGYYMGAVKDHEIFGFLADEEAFKDSPFSKMKGMSFSGFSCEACFYDALLQGVKGDPVTRRDRQLDRLEKVIASQYVSYYEYQMARYLIGELKGRFSTPQATIETFIAAAADQDLDRISRCFADSAPAEFDPLRKKTASQVELDELAAFMDGAEIINVEMSEKQAGEAVVTVKLKSRNEKIYMKKTTSGWQIVDF